MLMARLLLERGHGARRVAGTHLRSIFIKDHVADPVKARLDGSNVLGPRRPARPIGLGRRAALDARQDHDRVLQGRKPA